MSAKKCLSLSMMLLLAACQKQSEPNDSNKPVANTRQLTASNPQPISEIPTASTTGATVIVANTPATLPPPPIEFQQLDVPIFIKGTPALLHPIVTVIKDNKGSMSKEFLGKSGDKDDTNSHYATQLDYFNQVGLFDYQTNIDNLVFEDINAEKSQRLFNQNNFKIRRVFFPYIDENNRFYSDTKAYAPKKVPANASTSTPQAAVTDKEKPDVQVNQKFTVNLVEVDGVKYKALPRTIFEVNEAGKNGGSDKIALYMSDNFGHGMTRLHPANQFLVSSEWVEALQRFYFITQVDSDNNGIINDKDQTFHYYIDFTSVMPMIKSYRY